MSTFSSSYAERCLILKLLLILPKEVRQPFARLVYEQYNGWGGMTRLHSHQSICRYDVFDVFSKVEHVELA